MGECASRKLPFHYLIQLIMKIYLPLLPLLFTLLFSPTSLAVERLYYVAADELTWDYAPIQQNLMMAMPLSEEQDVFVKTSPDTIGSRYKKALFRQYTDASFTTLKSRSSNEQHLGLLGPVFRAEVGDTIKVVFKNNAVRPYSIHPHGVFYDKANEGAPTNDGTSEKQKRDDAIAPGGSYTYTWEVRETAGPGPSDPSSIVWPYHSHVSSIEDSNSGLIGAIIITAKGQANADATPKNVDREFINVFTVMDENASWYLQENIANTIGENHRPQQEVFEEGNLMHMINGYVFANIPKLTMKNGDRVRWYLIALGTEVDLHTPHWHGHTGLVEGRRVDTVELMPASMKTLDMTADNPGTWMYHCHVNDHIAA